MWVEAGGRRREEAVLTQLKNPDPIWRHTGALRLFPQKHSSTAASRISIRDGPLGVQFAAKFFPEKALPQGRNITTLPGQNCPWWLQASEASSIP